MSGVACGFVVCGNVVCLPQYFEKVGEILRPVHYPLLDGNVKRIFLVTSTVKFKLKRKVFHAASCLPYIFSLAQDMVT